MSDSVYRQPYRRPPGSHRVFLDAVAATIDLVVQDASHSHTATSPILDVGAKFVWDTCTDINGTTFASHVPEIGGTISLHPSFTDTMSIQSNRVGKDSGAVTSVYLYSATPPGIEYTIRGDVTDLSNVGRAAGIAGWASPTADNMIVWRRQNATTWQFLKIIGVSVTELETVSATFVQDAVNELTVERVGDLFYVYLNRVLTPNSPHVIADSEFQTPGKFAIRSSNDHSGGTGYHIDNLAAFETAILSIQNSAHDHTANSIALTQVHSLTVQNATHAHTVDSLPITQAHILTTQNSAHSHSAENLTLSQVHQLSVESSAHSHAAENVTVTQAHELVVASASHQHSAENIALAQVYEITVQNAAHAHSVESATLTQVHSLSIADAIHPYAAEGLNLTQAHGIIVADAVHDHAAGSPALTQVHLIEINSASHSHLSENVALGSSGTLGIQDATHGHSAQDLVLTQAHNLIVADSTLSHVAENLALTQSSDLVITNTTHSHSAANVILETAISLDIQSASHLQTADGVVVTQAHSLITESATHVHAAQNIALTSGEITLPPPRRTFMVESGRYEVDVSAGEYEFLDSYEDDEVLVF